MAKDPQNPITSDDFYIGYQPAAPRPVARYIRLTIMVLALLMPLIAAVLVMSQRPFSTGTYELGKFTVVEGIAALKPVPSLKISAGKDVNGKPLYQTLVLMSFGKFGAENHLLDFQEEIGKPLDQVVLKLEGVLDYRDGKALFELTRRKESLVGISEDLSAFDSTSMASRIEQLGVVTLTGEIVDPKCYMGTMKPGEGKPHRSCAIRCVSGGIPPVLVTTNEAGQHSYYLLRGLRGEQINDRILDFIADPVLLKGELVLYDDWYVLHVDPDKITRL